MFTVIMGATNSRTGYLALILLFYVSTSLSQSLVVPKTLLESWNYTGCYTDSVEARSLKDASISRNNMTNLDCVNFCSKSGWPYAGTEYGEECWCGRRLSTASTKTPDSDCSSSCKGDDNQACGGSYRLTVFNNTGPRGPPYVNPGVHGYRSLGCYTDNQGERALSTEISGTLPGGYQNSTVSNCISACSSREYALAGLQYYGECWCGNELQSESEEADEFDCNTVCNGNKTELCGGPNRLNLYTNATLASESNSSTALSTSTAVLTISLSSSLSSSVLTSASISQTTDLSSSSVVASTSATPTSSNSTLASTSLTTSDVSSSSIISSSTLSVSSSTSLSSASTSVVTSNSTSTTLASTDSPTTVLTTSTDSSGLVSATTPLPSSSSDISISLNSSTTQSTTPTPRTNTTTSSISSSVVSLNSSAISNSSQSTLFSTSATSISSSPALTATSTSASTSSTRTIPGVPTALPSGWHYNGCWIDNAYGRVMSHQLPGASDMTVERCIGNCTALGYGVAGIEYASECFCDHYLQNSAKLGAQGDCNMACSGNPNQFCGAGDRLSVYSNSTANLTVYSVPAVQKTNLPEFWEYYGCLKDDAPGGLRALPYQQILKNNNSANNCIKQCGDFGYSFGGMEYGEECYCGDLGHIQTAGVGNASESECSFACTGNPETICGGQRRLSVYKWTGPNRAAWNYASGNAAGEYQFLIGGVVVALITQAARNGKVTFLEKSGTGAPNTTGAYELDLAQLNNFTGAWRPMHVKSDIFCSASITLPDKVGRQLNVGGWALDDTFGVRLYWPDGSPGVWGVNDWQENVKTLRLQNGRWYPTAMVMANGTVLVVGGEEGSNGKAVPTLEILPTQGPVIYCDWLNRTDPNNLYPYLAVLPGGGIFVQYYNEAIILDEVTFEIQKQLPNVPAAVNRPDGGRTYPLEGTAVLLPQHAPYTDPLEILICGGSTPMQGYALDNCVSIAPEVPNSNWTIERMPSVRVLSCMTALPDGTYLILNGAKQGVAGFTSADDPNLNAVLYDPTRPLYNRFTVMANTTVARMYHSEAILLDDGRVLVSGSDPQDADYPQEYRVEVFVPPYLMGNPVQPVVTLSASQSDWVYGGSYTFSVSQAVSRVSLMGVGGSTHGNSMGQRTIFPAFACSGGSCTVTAPPNAHVCPPGWFQLFALNANGVPSKAVWVRIGGDPAGLGNWPPVSGFKIPGV